MAENSDQVLHFNEYFRIIRNRLWVIFTIFILTFFSGAYVTEEVLPKVYMAVAEIQINHRAQTEITGLLPTSTPDKTFDPVDFQSDFEVMQSSQVLVPIIQQNQYDKIWAKRVFKSAQESLPMPTALSYMANNILHFDVKRNTNIITITAQSQVPQEAADIANQVAEAYRAMRDAEESQRSTHGSDTLRTQITEQEDIVKAKRADIAKLRQDAGAANVDIPAAGTSERDETDLESRKRDLLASKEEADSRKVLLEKVKGLSDDDLINTLTALGRTDPNIATLRADVFKIEGDIDNLLKDGFEDKHPRILAMRAEIDRKKEQIQALIAGVRRALEVDVQMGQSRVDLLQKVVDDLTVKIRNDQTTHLEPYRQAQRDLESQQLLLDTLNLRLHQNETDYHLLESPVVIFSPATVPEGPFKPNKKLLLAISGAAGLLLGLIVAFLIEYLDTSVKTMADAESLLGLPVLTVIPNKGGPLPLTQNAAALPHAEGYRILRAKLDLKVQNGVSPSLSMLSGGPGEGKSTTIYNLAVVCAQAGQSVILVDCDLRRPTVHSLVNLPNDHGLANYLRGEGEAVEYIQQTALPKLHVLASGDMPLSDIGVLAGDKIRAMLEDLKQRYDLVLVDSPPVLGISDGSIIAREVDYVILVIQHRRYPREISLRAKRAIEEVHGNCVGMVLNSVAVKSDDSYYYYSNYGNYYKKVDRTKKRKEGSKAKAKANGKAVAVNGQKKDLDSEEF